MRTTLKTALVTAVASIGLLVVAASAGAGPLPTPLAPLEFLLGEWDGGGGVSGQAGGGTTFAPGLQDRIVTRTNFAVVGATEKTPASRHDDFMVIFADDRGVVRADYWDNEGHAIRYVVTFPGQGRAVFTSDPTAGAPRYRLTYEASPGGVVKGAFLLAPPDTPDAFAPYLVWEMRRKPRS
jgi:hypothetical protein